MSDSSSSVCPQQDLDNLNDLYRANRMAEADRLSPWASCVGKTGVFQFAGPVLVPSRSGVAPTANTTAIGTIESITNGILAIRYTAGVTEGKMVVYFRVHVSPAAIIAFLEEAEAKPALEAPSGLVI